MNFRDLIPDLSQFTQVKDVESSLLKRKRAGNSAGIVAALAAGLQIALIFSNQEYLERIGKVVYSLVRFRFAELADIEIGGYQALGWLVVFVSAVIYFVLRRTRLLLKESREPFRYTFWIQPFTLLSETPKERCKLEGADRFHLLHHDLAERLAQRIQRFSILEEAGDTAADDEKSVWLGRSSSHIQVSGSVAVREESDRQWVLHVMPLIRMGPSSSPATLAPSVKYPLDCIVPKVPSQVPANGEAKVDVSELVLTADEYNQMVERVYSRVATEVYAQIELDVRNKIDLFPTAYTRAVALYHEAEDFARSNTIDAYDRAIALYREALRYFQLMPAKSLQTLKLHIPLWWRRAIGFQHQRARVVTGYAKCLVYKNRMSTLAGRDSNPLYELPELLEPVIKNVELIHRKLGRTDDVSQLHFLLADVLYPQDSWLKRRLGHSYTPRFEAQKRTQFELYIVEALVHFFLGSRKRANKLLERAQSTAADMVAKDPLYLLARGLVEPVSEKAIPYLRQAVDNEPNFQMAQWFLAQAYEKEFRVRDEIEEKRALSVIDEYAEVLRINYGNIAALAAQGHLLWLISDPDAKRKFEEGREIKAIARETFVGQLNYSLARIAAEKEDYDECRNRYTEAVSADPTLGAHVPIAGSRGYRSDYDDIGPEMLNRFLRYKEGVENSLERLRANASENGNQAKFTEKTIGVVHGFVLNDYANACLRYFHHHGDHEQLQRAVAAYEKATRVNPTDAVPWFNLQNAYGWENAYEKAASCFPRARELAPTWSRVAIDAARDRVVTTMVEIRKEEAKSAEADERMQDLDQELFDVEKELAELPRVDIESRSEKATPTIGAGTPVAMQGQVGSDPLAEQQTAVSDLNEKIQRLKRGQGAARREVAETKRRLEELGKQFEEGMTFALKELSENSRLAALFEGSLNEQIDRVVAIPWRKLDSNDVETLIALAEVLAGGGVERPMHLAATQRLAEHLLKMYAEDHRVLGLLRDVVPKLIDLLEKQIDDPSKETHFSVRDAKRRLKHLRELLNDANSRWKTLVNYWMQTDEGTFLALYWYVDQDVDMQALDRVREQYFKREDDRFENLLGHVYFRLFRFNEAAEAYGKAATRNDAKASYHFNRGRSLNALGDSEGALSAFYRAHRLAPDQKEYSENLASAYNQLANKHYSSANYSDAIDNYLRAISLQGDVDFYHSNLSLAWEWNKEAPENIALAKAIEAMERATQLAPHETQHQKDLKRLQTRQTMVELYGQSEMAKRVTGVTRLVIDFASDLSDVILGEGHQDLHPSVSKRITTMREKFKKTFGVDLPRSTWRVNSDLVSGTYIISIDEVPQYLSTVPIGKKLCMDVDQLARLGIPSEPALPAHGSGAWLAEPDWIKATDAGLQLLDSLDAMLLHIRDSMRGYMADLIGHSEVRDLLNRSEEPNVAALAKSPDAVNTLTIVLQGLLAEGVSIAAIEDICDYFVEAFGKGKSIREMIEDLRKHKRLNEKLPGNSPRTVLLPLGKTLEKTLTDSLVSSDSLQILAITPEACQEALAAVRSAVSDQEDTALVVTDSALRNPLRKLVELEFPRLPVLAHDELLQGLHSNPERAVEFLGGI